MHLDDNAIYDNDGENVVTTYCGIVCCSMDQSRAYSWYSSKSRPENRTKYDYCAACVLEVFMREKDDDNQEG